MAKDELHPRRTPAESLLSELTEAERAGVFRRSPVDPASLTASCQAPRKPRFNRTSLGWSAAAAAFLLLATAWSMLFYREFGEMRERMTESAARAHQDHAAEFLACVGGPAGTANHDCASFDYTADGRIDMADFRSFQLGL